VFEFVGHHPDDSPERFFRHRRYYNSRTASDRGPAPEARCLSVTTTPAGFWY